MDQINWHSVFFLLFALLAIGFAGAVVVSSNIVRMAFYLVMSLAATAGLFFLAGADFVAVCQAVWSAEDPASAVAAFGEVLNP